MTPRRWITGGWVCVAVAVALAVAAVVQALDAVRPRAFQPLNASQIVFAGLDAPAELMRGLISAVLAGVAFFTGLACFFWGALLDSRQQMTRILEHLRDGPRRGM